jgi:hypothetical protein
MVSHLLFSQLALIALGWLFFLLLYAWPSDRAHRPHPAAPIAPRRQRSNDPTPFAGLTQQPHCALCEQDLPPPQAPPAVRPDPMPPTHRRPRTVDISQHFCPHRGFVKLLRLRLSSGERVPLPSPTCPLGGALRTCHFGQIKQMYQNRNRGMV